MLGNYTRSVTLTVAASNSSADSQAEADYLCTGTNDQTQIQAALNALPTNGGRVVLLERTYNISATIRIEKGSTALEGQGTGQRARVTQAGIGTKLLAASGLTVRIGTAVDGVLYFSNGGTDTHLISSIIFNNNDNVRIKAGSIQITANHFYNATRYNVYFDNAGARTKLVRRLRAPAITESTSCTTARRLQTSRLSATDSGTTAIPASASRITSAPPARRAWVGFRSSRITSGPASLTLDSGRV